MKKKSQKIIFTYCFSFIFILLLSFYSSAQSDKNAPEKKPIQNIQSENFEKANNDEDYLLSKPARKKKIVPKYPKKQYVTSREEKQKNKAQYASYPSSSEISQEKDFITLDFKGEIKDLIKMFSELMERNVIYDETFRDKITIIAPKKLSKTEAWNIFLAVLDYRGYNIVESKEAIRIVKSQAARQSAIGTFFKDDETELSDSSQLITYVTHLKYAQASQIRSALGQLISPRTGNISTYNPTNTLIITDTTENIKRLLKIIESIDVAGLDELPVISVLPLENASAKTLAAELREILQGSLSFSARGAPNAPKTPQKAGANLKGIKIIPDERLNALIVVATLQITTQIEDLLEKLDAPIEKGSSKVNVYYLNNAVAEDIRSALTGLIKSGSSAGKPPVGRPGGVQPTAPLFGNNVIISSDKSTNALIIAASPEDYQLLKKIIAKLDIMKPQVFIEALIIEVSQSKLISLGLDLNLLQKLEAIESDNIRAIGLSSFGPLAGLIASTASGGGGIPSLPDGGTVAITKGTITLADGTQVLNIGALATMFARESGINVIAQPQIITTDNEEAKILVGENRRFIKSSTIVSESANTVNTFEFRDVALELIITPHINQEGFVRMEIEQTVENVLPGTGSEQGVETNKREAKTIAVAMDQETIIIGGLIRETNSPSVQKIPCLGDIPLIGWLFSSRSNSSEKTNLLFFIKPTIIDTPAELAKLTAKKKDIAKKAREENEKSKDFIYRTIIDGNYKFWKKKKDDIPLLDEDSKLLNESKPEETANPNEAEIEINEGKINKDTTQVPLIEKPVPEPPKD